ncbi:MAG: hypothetical protein JWM26_3073 [Betaproteobacteria bacterium]|nr:hypothetical protein [Betaproteobacteria bacterium]
MSNSLQQITDAWGNWVAGQYPGSGGILFTASTNYGAQSFLDGGHQYQVSATVNDVVYDPYAPSPIPGSASSVVTTYQNGTTLQQSITYSQSVTTNQAFNWSITESLSIGETVSVKAGLPAVAEVTESTTVTLTLSSTQGETSSTQHQWSVNYPLQVPPQSEIDASLVVTTQQYNINWTATVQLVGWVAIWFNNKIAWNHDNDNHWCWYIPIDFVFSQCQANNIIDTTGYQIGGGGVIAMSQGTFSGGQGVAQAVKVNQKPYSGSQGAHAEASAAPTTYVVPVAGNKSLVVPASD